MKKHRHVGLALAIAVLLLTLVVPVYGGLTPEGKNTIGLTIFFLVLLITEALPIAVSSLLTVGLAPVLNVTYSFADAVTGYGHPVIFFILASFGIAGAITAVPITKRFLLALLIKAGNGTEQLLLVIMVASAFLSFFMSNVPTCAIMMSISLEFIDLLEEGGEKESVGKVFMIAVPVATMIGGMATPASSSLNLLAISLLKQYTGQTIRFVQWMAVGIPLVLILIPFAWFLILKVYKPVKISPDKVDKYIKKLQHIEPLGAKEMYVIIIMTLMLGLWIASSWIPQIEVFTVALLGCVLFLMPGVDVLSWEGFLKGINWHIIFLSGTILSLAGALVNHNVSAWLFEMLYPAHIALSVHMLVGLAASVAFVLLLIVSSAPALITVLAGPFVAAAIANGVPPAFLIMVLAFCAGNCYLFPLDTVQLLTYSKGYYRMTEMGKSTVFLQIVMVIILAFWLPFAGGILGL